MPTIPNIRTLATNVDKEQLDNDTAVGLINLRPVNGKLVKTNGFGQLITAVPSDIFNYFFVYINENLTGGKLYIGAIINSGTNQVIIEGYDSNLAQWTQMNTGSDVTFNSMTFNIPTDTRWHHANLENPVTQLSSILRLYAGNIADTDAELIWIGFIDRDLYDGLFTVIPIFYGYPGNIDAPELNPTITQLQGGTFTPDASSIDTKFYKFANVYDGEQESLLGPISGVTYDESINMFGKFVFTFDVNSTTTFDETKQSNRITAINMYRADDADADYKLIQVIDFLRPSDETGVQTGSTSFTGQNHAFIPEATTIDFDLFTSPFTLEMDGFAVVLSTNPTGTGNTVFTFTASNVAGDVWNKSWRFVDSLSAEMDKNLLGGAYTGINTLIIPDASPELEDQNYSGGIVEITSTPVTHSDNITSVSVGTDSGDIKYTTPFGHNLKVDDIVTITEMDAAGNTAYNGTFTVLLTDTNTTFEIENVAFNATDTGHFIKQSDTRIISDNVGFAVRSNEAWTINRNNQTVGAEAWQILSPVEGLFFPSRSTDTITYTIYDTGLLGTSSAPLQGEKSINVNGKFAIEVSERLFKYNVTLDPTSTTNAEKQPDWLMFSEQGQVDVMPVSNRFPIQSKEGGEGTGLAELFGNVVCMKPHSITTLFLKTRSDDPTQWFTRTSAFNVGNIAPNGFITVGNANLYVIYHNGIYRFRPNDLAEANESSVKDFRISEPINDIFLALTLAQKQAVHSVYDEERDEVLFTFNTRVFAWNIQFESWREVSSGGFHEDLEFADVGQIFGSASALTGNNVLFATDQDGEALVFPFSKTLNNIPQSVVADFKIRSASVAEPVPISVQSKTFVTSLQQIHPRVVRYLSPTYTSDSTLNAEIYTEQGGLDPSTDTPQQTITLPDTNNVLLTNRFRPSARAKKYSIRIADGRNTDVVEIHKIYVGNERK